MAQDFEAIVDLENLLELPIAGASGVEGDTHVCSRHVHDNMHKAYLYE